MATEDPDSNPPLARSTGSPFILKYKIITIYGQELGSRKNDDFFLRKNK